MAILPWQLKILAKMALSRLPIRYGTWSRLSMFKHGYMERPDYAIAIYERHFSRSQLSGSRGFTVLELGPGDSVASAVIANARGADQTYLVDVGHFARMDLEPYRALANVLERRGLQPIDIGPMRDVHEVLEACGGVYLTDGLASLRQVPTASVDFIWSNAVLEHVDRCDFGATLGELRRIIRDTGTSSHRIDLQDHLGASLHNLRFSSERWESPLFKDSGFYTNRLRCVEIVEAWEAAGFDAKLNDVERWDQVPIPRRKLASEFRHFTDSELRMRAIDIIARPRQLPEGVPMASALGTTPSAP